MGLITIPTVIFRNPIPVGGLYDIQGLLLAYGKYREAPSLTDFEKCLLMQLAATGEWLAEGGAMEDGVWMKDGEVRSYDQTDTLSFIQNHYKGHQVSLVPVEYDREAAGCCGMFCDILGSPDIGKEIRDGVETEGAWYSIEYFVSNKVDVRISGKPSVRVKAQKEIEENDIL